MAEPPNARILIKPCFMYQGQSFFLNDVKTDEAKKVIVAFLKKNFTDLPLTTFNRNVGSNYYFIDSGEQNFVNPDEGAKPYFKIIKDFNDRPASERIVSIHINGSPVVAELFFDKFDNLPVVLHNGSGQNIASSFEITDEDLSKKVIQKQLSKPQAIANITDLSRLHTVNVYFEGTASLLGANFSNSVVKDSDFMFVKLICANFTESQISGSFFDDADLRYANFDKSIMEKNNFQRANLTGANFELAKIGRMLGHSAVFEKSNCRGTIFNECDFTWGNFKDADLRGAKFINCKLAFAMFNRANLTGAVFDGPPENMFETDFTDAIIITESSDDKRNTLFTSKKGLTYIEPEFEFVEHKPKKTKTKTKKTATKSGGKRKSKARKYTINRRKTKKRRR